MTETLNAFVDADPTGGYLVGFFLACPLVLAFRIFVDWTL